MTHLLQYDPNNSLFWYPAKDAFNVTGGFRMHRASGDVYAFYDTYPRNLIALKSFKTRNKAMKATPVAAQRIKEIAAVPGMLEDAPTVEKNSGVFKLAPYQHQKRSIEHMLQYQRLMLLLEQGLGKTFISYMGTQIMKESGIPHRTLVVCPLIVMPNWLREVPQNSDLRILPYYGSPRERLACAERIRTTEWDMVVTTFDMLVNRSGTTKMVLSTMWDSLRPERRSYFIDKWQSAGFLEFGEDEFMAKNLSTKAYADGVARILQRIVNTEGSRRYMPLEALRDAERAMDPVSTLKSFGFDNLIVDEASRCLDHSSSRSQSIESLAATMKRVYLLSGTLCVGRPTDLYMPTRILDPSILGSNWTEFKKRYCKVASYNKNIITGYKNLEELKMLTDPYILAIKRDQCLDMPERVFVRRYYDVSREQMALYNKIVRESIVEVGGGTITTEMVLQKHNKLQQVLSGFLFLDDKRTEVCGTCEHVLECVESKTMPWSPGCTHPGKESFKTRPMTKLDNGKLSLLEQDLQELEGEKIIIWAWYRYDLEVIQGLLTAMGIKYITADTHECDRIFNENEDIRVFLGQTKQGIGITLNAATTTIYYSHGPDLEARLQSLDRNYRIGQTKAVTVHDYVCPGTLEENILDLLHHKEDVQNFMQAEVGCLFCGKFAGCMSSGRIKMTGDCPHYNAKEIASTKMTLSMGSFSEE